ncbi:Vitamin B12 import ATP-binding protein BtuD [Streptomyces griseoloalbus]
MTRRAASADTRETDDGSGAVRRLAPHARRFLARRSGVLVRLALWSLAETGQAFLVGHGVARAVDQGFLAGDTRRGLLWLTVALVAVLLGAPVIRGVFAELAGLTEPLRDGLVRHAVDRSLGAAAAGGPGGTDRAAVSRLTNQVEIARDSFAGLVLTLRSFVFTAAGALLGLLSLHPSLLVVVLPPLSLGMGLFLVTLRPMAAAQRRALAADEALGDHAARSRAALRDLTACGTGPAAARRGAELIEDAAAAARVLAGWAAVRTAALGVAGHLPVLALLLAVPWLRGRGVTAGALLGAFTYLVQSLLPALHTLMTALGAAGSRLLVVLDRIIGPERPERPERTRAAEPERAGGPGSVRAPAATRTEPALAAAPRPAPGAGGGAVTARATAAIPGPGDDAPDLGGRPADRARTAAVELRSVTLSYGVRAEPVLDSLDLCVAPGEHLAVVGPSGIGKSTLTRLVAGTLAPSGGEVRVDGREVTGRPPAELAALRVLVPQEAYVFSGTLIRGNVTYLGPRREPRGPRRRGRRPRPVAPGGAAGRPRRTGAARRTLPRRAATPPAVTRWAWEAVGLPAARVPRLGAGPEEDRPNGWRSRAAGRIGDPYPAYDREREPEELRRGTNKCHGLLVIALTDERGRLLWISLTQRTERSRARSHRRPWIRRPRRCRSGSRPCGDHRGRP